MRNRFFVLALLSALSACNLVDEAKSACGDIAKQVEADVWTQCQAYYEGTVVPELIAAVQAAEAELKAECAAACSAACDKRMEDYSCTARVPQPPNPIAISDGGVS